MRIALSDQQIIEGIQKKDNEVLHLVYELYRQRVMDFVTYNNGTENDAEEVLQEAIISLYKELRKGDFVLRKSFDIYFRTVYRNTWKYLSKLKQKYLLIEAFSEGTMEDESDFFHEFKREQYFRIIIDTVNEMGEGCRKVLEMFYFQKMSMSEIAKEMNYKSVQMAKNKRLRCLSYLKEKIKAHNLYKNLRNDE
ncbi:MAG: hypothetical protein CVU05_03500 [Bacteroidetes bacterium HGW-Bacteroidetes-21]|jgi:RNA polymerase sigma factor (sigma-70 family)|nr:MAG: hypothetical protein CVU05_03500 [Bacteroidetes bacterium HGW-Bacteroidetes-21]